MPSQKKDISGWNPRKKPNYAASFDLKLRSMKTPHRWLYECLSKERHTVQIEDSDPTWGDGAEMRKDRIYQDYKYFCEAQHKKPDDERLFWKLIKQILGPLNQNKPRDGELRILMIKFPSLIQAREAFAKYAKEDMEELWEA